MTVNGAAVQWASPRYPSLIEINAKTWLSRLSLEVGRPITLAEIDDAILDRLSRRGFDWIWLLSVAFSCWRARTASSSFCSREASESDRQAGD